MLSIFPSCDDEENSAAPAPAPVTEILSISPKEGEAGITVKIRGKNFALKGTSVSFRGVEAQLLYVSDSLLEVRTPQNSGSGNVEVVSDGKTIQGPEFKFYSVYCYGRNYYKATYWKDGVTVDIHERGSIRELAVVGEDIHAIGEYYTPDFSYRTGYWKNGILSDLEGTDQSTILTGIAVSGNDVHICGYRRPPFPAYEVSMYWKNGKLVFEEPIHDFVMSQFNDIAVVGNDVYIVGEDYPEAIVWKNGTKIVLPGRYAIASPKKIRVIGSDVYVAGVDVSIGNQYKARFWKNEVEVPLTGQTGFGIMDFTFNEGEPVFVGASYDFSTGETPMQYQAGVLTPIANNNRQRYGSAIEITSTATYILTNASGPYYSVLTKDDTNITPFFGEGLTGYLSGFCLVYY